MQKFPSGRFDAIGLNSFESIKSKNPQISMRYWDDYVKTNATANRIIDIITKDHKY